MNASQATAQRDQCKCSSNGIPCSDNCSCCHEFFNNNDRNEILEDDSSDGKIYVEDEGGQNDK